MRAMCVLILATTAAAGIGLAASEKAKQPAKQQNAEKTAPKGNPLTLPKEAVRIEQFAYRYKDKDGKVWIYRETPFGLVRFEESSDAAAKAKGAKEAETEIDVVEKGDELHFERPGPFGKWKWTRKKTDELTGEEREAWERTQKTAKAAAQSDAKE